MTGIELSQEQLLDQLEKNGFPAEIQEETGQVAFVMEAEGWQYPCFLRIYPGDELLQFLGFIPVPLEAEVKADLARVLHLMNKELDLPGLGMDENSSTVFYRLMLPCREKKFDADMLRVYLAAMNLLFATYGEALVAFSTGNLKFQDLMAALSDSKVSE